MAFNFIDAPFATDLPELMDLEKWLKRKDRGESFTSWESGGQEVINLRQTLAGGYDPNDGKPVKGVVDEATFNKFVDKHFNGDMQKLVRSAGIKLANDGWLCISLHTRPDEHVKMEWLANKQQLLTFNISTHLGAL